jgi:hypothetical protein
MKLFHYLKSSLFISPYFDPSPSDVRTKIITSFNRCNSSMSTTFKSRIQLISTMIMGNQFLNGLETSIIPHFLNDPTNLHYRRKEVRYFVVSYQYTADGYKCFCTQ